MPTFKVGRIVVVTVWAEDVPQAAQFYQDVLGLQEMITDHPDHDHLTRFQLKSGYLILLQGKPHAAEAAVPDEFPLFALSVDDLDKAVEQLEAHDIALPWGVESSEHSRWVMFYDVAGNLIELVQHQ